MSDIIETKMDTETKESEAKVEYLAVKKIPETVKATETLIRSLPGVHPAPAPAPAPVITNLEFRFDVTADDKDNDSKESILIRRNSDGKVMAQVHDPDSNRWTKGTSWSLWPQPVDSTRPVSIPLDQLSLYRVELHHVPVGHDKFHFNLNMKAYSADNRQVLSKAWLGLRQGDAGRNEMTTIMLYL